MSNPGNESIILNTPIIAQLSYLNDCVVKLPVLLREKDGKFYLKNPTRPLPAWQMDLIIRSIDIPANHPVRFMKNPHGETDFWTSSILNKVGHSDYAEIYEITKPVYEVIDTGRRSPRAFCLAAVRCLMGDSRVAIKSICVDVSDSGFGLRFEEPVNINIGENCHIFFEPPLSNLPEIGGRIVRHSKSALDKSTSVGVILNDESKKQVGKIIDFLIQKQSQLNTDSFNTLGSAIESHDPKNGFADFNRAPSSDLFTMFSQSGRF
jgi:hypothetical protein